MPPERSIFDYDQGAKKPSYEPEWAWWETLLWDVVFPIITVIILIRALVWWFHGQPEAAFPQLLIGVFVFGVLMARQRWIMIQNGTWETEISKAKAQRKAECKANRANKKGPNGG